MIANLNCLSEVLLSRKRAKHNLAKFSERIVPIIDAIRQTDALSIGLQEVDSYFFEHFSRLENYYFYLPSFHDSAEFYSAILVRKDVKVIDNGIMIFPKKSGQCIWIQTEEFVHLSTHLPFRAGGKKRYEYMFDIIYPKMKEFVANGFNVYLTMDSNMTGECPWTARMMERFKSDGFYVGPQENTFWGWPCEAKFAGDQEGNSPLDLCVSSREPKTILVEFIDLPGREYKASDHAMLSIV